MTAVAPLSIKTPSPPSSLMTHHWSHRVLGLVFVATSGAMTAVYLTILDAFVQNDYFWTDFNASGTQTFVSDVFNTQLWNTSTPATLPLFTRDVASEKDYSQPQAFISVQATDARRIAVEVLRSIPAAIAGLRSQSTAQTTRSLTHYCWLDFNHQWEVAHTAARQARCRANYTANGVMYLESMLRNTDWMAWYAMWGAQFQVTYGSAIDESAGGNAWLSQTTTAMASFSIDMEVAYWTANGVTEFELSWHNRHVGGFDNVMVVHNALQSYAMPLHHVQYARRSGWTSVIASMGVYNDFHFASVRDVSLVRNASNSFVMKNPRLFSRNAETLWCELLAQELGPAYAIDILYVEPPALAVAIYSQFVRLWKQGIQSRPLLNERYRSFVALPAVALDMVPPAFVQNTTVQYYGGNPLCYQGIPQSYVQQPFGFDDTCSQPFQPFAITPSPINLIMALSLQLGASGIAPTIQSVGSICALAQTQACHAVLSGAISLWNDWSSPALAAPTLMDDLVALQIKFMQYASVNDTPTILFQPILDGGDPHWSFYGWLHIVEWLQGAREVVSFQGDSSTWVLMSKPYVQDSFQIDSKSIPSRMSHAIWLLLCYMCGISGFVLTIVFIYVLYERGQFCGQNLYFFSPVVGLVWIGRPLLLVRGLTAMTMLSSANIQLVIIDGFTRLLVVKRFFFEVLIVSGETLWLTFAINDILLIASRRHTYATSVVSCCLVWLVTFILEMAWPFQPLATVHRTCNVTNLDAQISCVTGSVTVGSLSRLFVLGWIQGICLLVSNCVARSVSKEEEANVPVVVPAVASHFLVAREQHGLYFDSVSSPLCGLIPLHSRGTTYAFSAILWMLIPLNPRIFGDRALRLESTGMTTPIIAVTKPNLHATTTRLHFTQIIITFVAVAFLIGSAFSSALFFYVLEGQLNNDFLWVGFNATGMQPFLLAWYNNELNFRPPNSQLNMAQGSQAQWYNSTSTVSISASFQYASTMQFEEISLINIVQGLRISNPCDLPWIATQYCWVDFGRKWEMAYTSKRQIRCQNMMTTNGAVYLDSILRNTNLKYFQSCWGNALEIGLFHDLRESQVGLGWIASLPSALSSMDEVAYWHSFGVSSFIVQWQNYKSLGVVETLDIQSATGVLYPLTLKASTGTYTFQVQTSMKMYWGWGSDLWAITHNDTDLGGASLIRRSGRFAFQNHTMETIVLQNQSLVPLDPGFEFVQGILGPFGTIDLVHVPCPLSLLQLVQSFSDTATTISLLNVEAQVPLHDASQSLSSAPTLWMQTYSSTRGGNFLCPMNAANSPLAGAGASVWFSVQGSCTVRLAEVIYTSQSLSLVALIASGAFESCNPTRTSCVSIQDACSNTTYAADICVKALLPVYNWTLDYMPRATRLDLFTQASAVQAKLLRMGIDIVQYAQLNDSSPIELLRATLFSPTDPYFILFSWMLVLEWVNGLREVVSFQGDVGSFQALSSYVASITSTPNALEIPRNLAYYCQLCIQYTTAMAFAITFFTLLYTMCARGYIEGLNMFEINRVGGIVWIGRPFLVLRSIVAIVVLATSQAALGISGIFTTIHSPKPTGWQWLSTLLAGSETCWLIIVLTDLLLVVTKDHSNRYSFKSSILGTLLSILLTATSPVTPSFHVARSCAATQLDFQLVCHAGVVQIGDPRRTLQLVVLTAAVVVICFAWEKWSNPTFRLPTHRLSLLLPAGGYYFFHKKPWIFHQTLYLDNASAFICGLITFSTNRRVYLLDIKTWRTHMITIDADFDPRLLSVHTFDQRRIALSVPLVI
ncbi:Aste57867_88 [Aphanomyces stellatus]|uniref:Aste57867_88 protein n=1 Tax=Aphanomyces stellatus TaxID=120398 RepID=A0A485K6Q1_9STRA|nr:hypothetical protein As57867_000088 [Aphanomyces stellatus]VFT77314.1 Aste57867_88 [Aphanomyces stellatus]